MICFCYRIYGLFRRELTFSYAAQRALKILGKVFPFCAGCNSIVRITDSFIVNISTNTANILFQRFYLLLYLYYIKSYRFFVHRRDFFLIAISAPVGCAVSAAECKIPSLDSQRKSLNQRIGPVSYTHLTLPTTCQV